MQNYRSIAAAVLALSFVGPAMAQEINPIESQSVRLEGVAGDVYYTVQPDGYHLVATFASQGDSRTPFRFETVLAPGQSPWPYGAANCEVANKSATQSTNTLSLVLRCRLGA